MIDTIIRSDRVVTPQGVGAPVVTRQLKARVDRLCEGSPRSVELRLIGSGFRWSFVGCADRSDGAD